MVGILPDRRVVGRRHYILNPSKPNWWVSFSHWQLEHYRLSFADDFCVILARPKSRDEAYVIPFALLKHLIYVNGQRPSHTERWHATIVDGEIRMRGRRLFVEPFHNYFALLNLFPVKDVGAAA